MYSFGLESCLWCALGLIIWTPSRSKRVRVARLGVGGVGYHLGTLALSHTKKILRQEKSRPLWLLGWFSSHLKQWRACEENAKWWFLDFSFQTSVAFTFYFFACKPLTF